MTAPIDSGRRGAQNAGKELFEIQPVIVGGNPTDPANKTYLAREQHIEAVRYWNRIISELRRKAAEEENTELR